MSTDAILARLQSVFQEVFDDPALKVHAGLTAADVDGWDSVRHITLIVAVENEFGVRLSTSEVAGLHDVGDLLKVLERKAARG